MTGVIGGTGLYQIEGLEVLDHQADDYSCACRSALKSAVLTQDDALSSGKRKLLGFLKE